jgi:hypothetical protein
MRHNWNISATDSISITTVVPVIIIGAVQLKYLNHKTKLIKNNNTNCGIYFE